MELQIKVAQAVRVLNHDSQSCNRVAANQWLVQFQQTDAAWEVATSILTSDHHHHHHQRHHQPFLNDFEVEFFAAQILKRKIQNEGYYLQLGAKDALLNALLVAAKRFSSGPSQLLTQICLALSALILHAVEHSKPIEQLFYSLENLQSQDDGNIAVLEMLTVLPEVVEDQSTDSIISPARRGEYGRELLLRTPMVLEFLLQQSEKRLDAGIQLHERNKKILRCLLSWVRVGCFSEIPPSSLPAHPLLNFVFNSLQVSLSFDLAIEVLVELVSRHEGLPQVLLCRVGFLKEVLLLPALTNGDEKVIGCLACLMSEIGQAAPSLIVEASSEALALADALLRADALLSCVAYPSEEWEIADSTLQFWCCLASYILGLDVDSGKKKKIAEDMFSSVFSALLDALLLRAQETFPCTNQLGSSSSSSNNSISNCRALFTTTGFKMVFFRVRHLISFLVRNRDYCTSTAFETGLRTQFEEQHLPHLRTLYRLQSKLARPIYISVKEYMDIFLKLGPHEYRYFEKFITDKKIRVSSMINTPLLEQPIGRVVWIPPPMDWIKINSDASFIKIGGIVYAAAGVVFRDHLGMIKGMHAIPLKGVSDSYEAELKAVECSLILARQYGFTKILIQLDNSFIVKAIEGGELPVKYYDLYRTLPLKEFKRYEFDYIPREGNQAANLLATRGRDWMRQPASKTIEEICRAFDTVRDCCKDDLAGQTYFRLKAQKTDFVQDGSDPYVQESSSANSSTSFPGPVSMNQG